MRTTPSLLLFALTLAFYSSCKNEEVVNKPNQFVDLASTIRPFLHDPGSKLVYQDSIGNLDSAIVFSVDSSVMTFNTSKAELIDMKVITVDYTSTLPFYPSHVFRSSYVTDNSNLASFNSGQFQFLYSPSISLGDSICGFHGNCITWLGYTNSMNVKGNEYYNVYHFKIQNNQQIWWDSNIGIIKYKTSLMDWELLRSELIN